MKPLALIALCFFSGLIGHYAQAKPPPIIQAVYVERPIYQPIKKGRYFGAQKDNLALVIPATALERMKR